MSHDPIAGLPDGSLPSKSDYRQSGLPRWKQYSKMSHMRLSDGIALSLNWSPRVMKIALRAHHKIRAVYLGRLEKARLEATPTGKIRVAERGELSDGSDWIIEIRSLVLLAEEYQWPGLPQEFKNLGLKNPPRQISQAKKRRGSRTPEAFVVRLNTILTILAQKAAEKNEILDPHSMPGTKKEFWEFVKKADAEVDVTFPTFDTYIHGICKFKPGSRNRGYYLRLFDNVQPEFK